MKNINLLPESIILRKKSRKQKIYMAVLQVAILLCIGFAVLVINNRERQAFDHLQLLSHQITAMDEGPLLLAAELESARLLARQVSGIYFDIFPFVFETEWFEIIIETLPQGASIARLSYSGTEILFDGIIRDITYAEAYRQELSGYFYSVVRRRMTLQECGSYSYEMRISFGD